MKNNKISKDIQQDLTDLKGLLKISQKDLPFKQFQKIIRGIILNLKDDLQNLK